VDFGRSARPCRPRSCSSRTWSRSCARRPPRGDSATRRCWKWSSGSTSTTT